LSTQRAKTVAEQDFTLERTDSNGSIPLELRLVLLVIVFVATLYRNQRAACFGAGGSSSRHGRKLR
jgi:hypothetical protein